MMGPLMRDSQQRITTGTALQLLVKQQRRQILRRIAETQNGTTVDRLAQSLYEVDSTKARANGGSDHLQVQLQHVHLPTLQNANVIFYDTASGTVQRGEHFQAVWTLLESIDGHRDDPATGLS